MSHVFPIKRMPTSNDYDLSFSRNFSSSDFLSTVGDKPIPKDDAPYEWESLRHLDNGNQVSPHEVELLQELQHIDEKQDYVYTIRKDKNYGDTIETKDDNVYFRVHVKKLMGPESLSKTAWEQFDCNVEVPASTTFDYLHQLTHETCVNKNVEKQPENNLQSFINEWATAVSQERYEIKINNHCAVWDSDAFLEYESRLAKQIKEPAENSNAERLHEIKVEKFNNPETTTLRATKDSKKIPLTNEKRKISSPSIYNRLKNVFKKSHILISPSCYGLRLHPATESICEQAEIIRSAKILKGIEHFTSSASRWVGVGMFSFGVGIQGLFASYNLRKDYKERRKAFRLTALHQAGKSTFSGAVTAYQQRVEVLKKLKRTSSSKHDINACKIEIKKSKELMRATVHDSLQYHYAQKTATGNEVERPERINDVIRYTVVSWTGRAFSICAQQLPFIAWLSVVAGSFSVVGGFFQALAGGIHWRSAHKAQVQAQQQINCIHHAKTNYIKKIESSADSDKNERARCRFTSTLLQSVTKHLLKLRSKDIDKAHDKKIKATLEIVSGLTIAACGIAVIGFSVATAGYGVLAAVIVYALYRSYKGIMHYRAERAAEKSEKILREKAQQHVEVSNDDAKFATANPYYAIALIVDVLRKDPARSPLSQTKEIKEFLIDLGLNDEKLIPFKLLAKEESRERAQKRFEKLIGM